MLIFVRCERLIARKLAKLLCFHRGVRPFYAPRCFDAHSRWRGTTTGGGQGGERGGDQMQPPPPPTPPLVIGAGMNDANDSIVAAQDV